MQLCRYGDRLGTHAAGQLQVPQAVAPCGYEAEANPSSKYKLDELTC